MKIRIYSDLHLEHFHPGEILDFIVNPGESIDVLILAGDILTVHKLKKDGYLNELYREFLNHCSKNFKNVLYVAGNHEAYGYHLESSHSHLKEILESYSNIHFMENDSFILDDWVFLGATLWTDFFRQNPLAMMEAHRCINDYSVIRTGSNYRKLSPDDVLKRHLYSVDYFEFQLNLHKDKNVFIITHMAPSSQSIHEMYRGSLVNSAYVSDLDMWAMDFPQLKYWVHGHVHHSFQYDLTDTCKVICNPKGYGNENNGFNPKFTLTI
jgi:UDP-2,3-diacylglucosamine pyrophosphatase LpxH